MTFSHEMPTPAGAEQGIDLSQVAPRLGALTPFYREIRRVVPDGAVVAQHAPRRSLADTAAAYEDAKRTGQYSPGRFLVDHFLAPENPVLDYKAPEGMGVPDYTHMMRAMLLVEPDQQPNGHTIMLPETVMSAAVDRFWGLMFGWDSGLQNYGLAVDGDYKQIEKYLRNKRFLIDGFGHDPNANTDYYVTRGQISFFDDAVMMSAWEPRRRDPTAEIDREVILKNLPYSERKYRTSMIGIADVAHLPDDGEAHASHGVVRMPDGESYLNRPFDFATGPRYESLDEDMERAELAALIKGLTGEAAEAEKARVYESQRTSAASGRDHTVEWQEDPLRPETTCAQNMVTADWNCKKMAEEEYLSFACAVKAETVTGDERAGYLQRSQWYGQAATERWAAIEKYLWDPVKKEFRSRNFVTGKQTDILSGAEGMVLAYGRPNPEQTWGVVRSMKEKLLSDGGIIASTAHESHEQWDSFNVWGVDNLTTAWGAARMYHLYKPYAEELKAQGYDVEELLDFAKTIQKRYTWGNSEAFRVNRVIPEKFRGNNPTQLGYGGEYEVVPVLGMNLEINYALLNWDPEDPEGFMPVDPLSPLRQEVGRPLFTVDLFGSPPLTGGDLYVAAR